MKKLRFWTKQMFYPDDEHEDIVAVITGLLASVLFSGFCWYWILTY